MLSIPKTPCPVDGLVQWMGQRCPIKNRKEHSVFGWLYTVHHRNGSALVVWANVSQEDVVREMERTAKFKIGDTVQIGPFVARRIIGRKWDFESGAFRYTVEGSRPDQNWVVDEDELLARTAAGDQP